MSLSSLLRLFVLVGGTFFVAVSGSVVTTPNIDPWYTSLLKPGWVPPNWLFAPVWTILYFLMALAAFFVWQKGCHKPAVKMGLTLYILQLGINFLWSFLFFGFHELAAAFATILGLLALIIITAFLFWRLDKKAGLLFIPYILWVSFATLLNLAVWRLNR